MQQSRGICYAQKGLWTGDQVIDLLAQHESVHSRLVASVGELGFYVTYLIAGFWGAGQSGRLERVLRAERQGLRQPVRKTRLVHPKRQWRGHRADVRVVLLRPPGPNKLMPRHGNRLIA
jgi:hypothetical protein